MNLTMTRLLWWILFVCMVSSKSSVQTVLHEEASEWSAWTPCLAGQGKSMSYRFKTCGNQDNPNHTDHQAHQDCSRTVLEVASRVCVPACETFVIQRSLDDDDQLESIDQEDENVARCLQMAGEQSKLQKTSKRLASRDRNNTSRYEEFMTGIGILSSLFPVYTKHRPSMQEREVMKKIRMLLAPQQQDTPVHLDDFPTDVKNYEQKYPTPNPQNIEGLENSQRGAHMINNLQSTSEPIRKASEETEPSTTTMERPVGGSKSDRLQEQLGLLRNRPESRNHLSEDVGAPNLRSPHSPLQQRRVKRDVESLVIAPVVDIEVNGSMFYRVGQLLLQKGQQIKEVLQRGIDTDFASHFKRIGEGIRRLLSGRWNNFVKKILPDRTADKNTTAPITDEHQPLHSFFDRLRGLLDFRNGLSGESGKPTVSVIENNHTNNSSLPNQAADDPFDVQTTSKTDLQRDRNSVPILFQPIDIVSNTIENQKQSTSQNGSVVALEKNGLSPDPTEPLFNNSDVPELSRRVKREDIGMLDVLDMFRNVNTNKLSYLNIPVLDGIGKAIETINSGGWTSSMEDDIFGSLHQLSKLQNMVILKRFLKKLQGGVSLDLLPFAEQLRDLASSIDNLQHPKAFEKMTSSAWTWSAWTSNGWTSSGWTSSRWTSSRWTSSRRTSSGWTSSVEDEIFDFLQQLGELQNMVDLKRFLKKLQGGASLDLLPFAEHLRDLASAIDTLQHPKVLRTAIEIFDMLYTERFLRDLTGFHSPIDVSRYRQLLRNLIEPLRHQHKTHDSQTFVDRVLGSYQEIITQISNNELVSFIKLLQNGENYGLHLSRFQPLLSLVTTKNSIDGHQDFDVWMGQLQFLNSSLGHFNQTISGTPASEINTDQNITLHSVKRRQVPSQSNKKGNFPFLNHSLDLSTEGKQKIHHAISKFASVTLFDMMQALRRKDEPLQNLRGLKRFHRLTSGLESYQNMNDIGQMLLAINKLSTKGSKKRLHGSKESKREIAFSQKNLLGDFYEEYQNETSKHRLLSFLDAILRIKPNISSSRNNSRLLELATHISDNWFGHGRNEDFLYYLFNFVQSLTEENDILDFLKLLREHSFSRSDVNSPQTLANVMVRFISRGGSSNNTTLGKLLKLIWFPQQEKLNQTVYQTLMDTVHSLNHTSHRKDINKMQKLFKNLQVLTEGSSVNNRTLARLDDLMALMHVFRDEILSFEPPSDPNLALIDILLRNDANKNPQIDPQAFHSLARLMTSLQRNSFDVLTLHDLLKELDWFPHHGKQNKTVYQTLMDIVHRLNHTNHRKDVNMMQELSKNVQLLKERSSVNYGTLARFDDLMALMDVVGDEILSFEPPSDPNLALIDILLRNDANKNPQIDPQAFHSLARLMTSLQRNSFDVLTLHDLLKELGWFPHHGKQNKTVYQTLMDIVHRLNHTSHRKDVNMMQKLSKNVQLLKERSSVNNETLARFDDLMALIDVVGDEISSFELPSDPNLDLIDFLLRNDASKNPEIDPQAFHSLARLITSLQGNSFDVFTLQDLLQELGWFPQHEKPNKAVIQTLMGIVQSLNHTSHHKDVSMMQKLSKILHLLKEDSSVNKRTLARFEDLMALMYGVDNETPTFGPPSDPNEALMDFLLKNGASKNLEIDRPAFHSLARLITSLRRNSFDVFTLQDFLQELGWFPHHEKLNKTVIQTLISIVQSLNHTSRHKDVKMMRKLSKILHLLKEDSSVNAKTLVRFDDLMALMDVVGDEIPSFEPPSDPNLALIDILLRNDANKNPQIDPQAFHSLARLITSLQRNSFDVLTLHDFLKELGWFPHHGKQNKTVYQTLMDIVHRLNHTSHRKDVNMMQELSKNVQLLKERSSVNNETLTRFDDLMALIDVVGDEILSFEPPSDPNLALIDILLRNDANKNPQIDPQAFHSLARLITSLQRNSFDVLTLHDLFQELGQIGLRSEEKVTSHMDFLDVVSHLLPSTKFNGSKDLAIFANIMERARYSRNNIRALDHVLNALNSLQEDNLEGFYPVLQNMTLVDFLQLPVSPPRGDLGSIQDLANMTSHIPVTNNTDLHVLQQIVELWTQSQDKGDQKILLHPLIHLFQSLSDKNSIKDDVQELLNLTMITKHLHTISQNSRKISDILNTLQYIFEKNSSQSVVEGDELNFIDILDSLINNVSQIAWNEFDGSLAQLNAGAASQRLGNIGDFNELLRVVFHPEHLHDFPEKSDQLADIIGSLDINTDEESANGINPDLELLNKLFSNLQSNVSTVEHLENFLLDLEALQSGTSYQESTNPHIAMSFMDSLLHILRSNVIFDQGITNLQFLTNLIQDSEGYQYKGRLPILARLLRDVQHLQMTPYLEDFYLYPANISYVVFLQLLGDGEFSEDEVFSMQQLANLTNHFNNGNVSDEFLHLVKLLDLLQSSQKKTANEPELPSSSLLNIFVNPRDRYDIAADMDELRGMIPLSEFLNGPVNDMFVDEIRGLIDSNSMSHSLKIIKLVQFLRNAIHRGYQISSGDIGMLQALSSFASVWQANLTSSNEISFENLLKDLGNIQSDQQFLGKGDTEPLLHFLISALGKDDWNLVEFDRLSHFADMLENVSTAINTSEVQRMMMDMWFKPPQHPNQRYLKFLSDMQSNVHGLSNEDLVELNELGKAHADSFKDHDPYAISDVLSIIGGTKDERFSSLMRFLVSQQFPESYEPNEILMMQNVDNIIKRFIPTLTEEDVAEITKLYTSQVDHQRPIAEYLGLMLALRHAVAANHSLDVLTELKSLTKGLPPFGRRSLRYEDTAYDIQDLLRIFDTRNTDQGDILSFIDTLANEPYRPSWPWSNSVLPNMKHVAFHGHLPKNLGDEMLSSFADIFGQSRTGQNDQLMSLLDDVKETDDYRTSSTDVVAELDRHDTIKQWMEDSKSALRSYLQSVNDVLGSDTQNNAASFLDFLDYTDMYTDVDELNGPFLDLKNLSSKILRPVGNARATTSIYEELLKQFGPEVPHAPLLVFVDALHEIFSQPDIDVSNDPTKLNKMGSFLENITLPMTTALDDIHSILINTEGAKSYLDYMEDMLTSLTGIGTGVLPKLESLQDLQILSSPLVDKAILDDLDKFLGQKTSAEVFAAGLEATLQDEGMRNDLSFYQTSALLNNYQKYMTKIVTFQQYFGDLGDIVDVISQYSTLKESIHKPESDILDLFGDVQEFPQETVREELFQYMHTFQENIPAYGNNLESTIQLLTSIFDLTSPEFINENGILLNTFTDIAIHSENITKDESKLLYQRIAEHFEEPSEHTFMELLGNITLMLWANPEIETDEHLLNVIEGINWITYKYKTLKKLRNIVDEMRGIQGPLKQNASEILRIFTPLLVPSSNEITEQDNSDMFELFEGLAHVDDETSRNDTITLHEDIQNEFLEVPYNFSRELISELLSIIDTGSSDKMRDKVFLKLVGRFAAVKNDTHQKKLVQQLFEDMMTSVSWSYNETMPRLIEDFLHLHRKKKLFPMLDFIQTILVTNETEIENEQENMKIYDAMNRHVASPISFQDFTRYLDSIQDIDTGSSDKMSDKLFLKLVGRFAAVKNDTHKRKLVQQLFEDMMTSVSWSYNETMPRLIEDFLHLQRKKKIFPMLDFIQTILVTNETEIENEQENMKIYDAMNRHVASPISFQDFTRYLDSIQDIVNSGNKNDLIDVLETIYPVSENASRNESLALYKLITRTFNGTVFPRGPIEGLISFLWKASRKQSRQKILNSKAEDSLFLRLVDKVRIIKNESQHRVLLRRTFNDMIYRVSMRYNRTISSILEDILLLHHHEGMPPVLDLLQKSNDSRIGNKEANLKIFDDMNRQVQSRFQLPDFTRYLKNLQYFGEPRAPEFSMLVSFLQNASNFRYLKQSKSKWVDYFRLITNTSASATEDVLRTFDTLVKQSRQGTALLTVDQGTALINILKNISDGQWIHRDESSWRSIYDSFENASSASQGKHLNEFIKHIFGEVRNEDLSNGIFLDMIEGLQNKSLLTRDRVIQWMDAFRAIRQISLKELRNTLGSLLEIMSSLDAVLERPQPYPSPNEKILGFLQNITELSIPLQKSDSLNNFNEMIHRMKQTEVKLYPETVKGNRRLLLQLDSLFNPEEFEQKKREHVLLEFLLKIPRLLNASELDDGDLMALQQINDFDYFDYSIYEERPPEDNRGKDALVDDMLGVMQKLVRVNLNVWNNSFPQFIGQSPSISQQGTYDLHRMYYSLAEGIRMMSKAFHGIVSLLQNQAPTVEPEPTTTSPETNDLENFLNQVSNMSQLKTEPDLTLTIQRFSQLTTIVKNSNGSELEDVAELLSSLFGPRREKTDEWRLKNTDSIDNWSEWIAWSTCSVTCGHGEHVRRRTCSISIEGLLIASDQCVGKAEEISECQVECQEGSWARWSFWSRCDNRCGGGNQTRSRLCGGNHMETNTIHPVNYFCNGSSEEKKMCREYDFDECSLHEMFVPGTWSEWSAWTKCPDVCKGYRDRERSCQPLNEPIITRMKRDKGLLCEGDAKENVSCEYSTVCLKKMPPVINATWTAWSPWSRCNNRCGVGNQTRSRRCELTNPGVTSATHHRNHSCHGDSQEERTCSEYDFDECTLHDVFVKGEWSEWGQWSECSENCTGHRNRLRLCHPLADQTPIITRMKRDEGLLCEGDAKENVSCESSIVCGKKMHPDHPVIIASWTAWSTWSRCNNRCGVGNQTRSRRCELTNPGVTGATHHRNHSCHGDSQEKRTCSEYDFDECTLHDVFVPGKWSEWGQWSKCSENGTGHRNRHRICHPLAEQTSMITRMKRETGLLCKGNSTKNSSCTSSESIESLGHHHHYFDWQNTSKPVIVALAMIGFVLFVILIIWYFATTRRRRGNKPYRTDRGNSEESVFQTKQSSSDGSRQSSSRRSFLSWRSTSKESALFSDQQSEESVRLLDNEEIPPDPSRFCPYRGRPRSSKDDISAEWLYPWETEGDDWAGLDFEADNASNMNFDVYMEVDEAVEEPQTSVVSPKREPSAVGNRTENDQEFKLTYPGELEKSAEAWFD